MNFEKCITEEWQKPSQKIIKKLYKSSRQRMAAVIKCKEVILSIKFLSFLSIIFHEMCHDFDLLTKYHHISTSFSNNTKCIARRSIYVYLRMYKQKSYGRMRVRKIFCLFNKKKSNDFCTCFGKRRFVLFDCESSRYPASSRSITKPPSRREFFHHGGVVAVKLTSLWRVAVTL